MIRHGKTSTGRQRWRCKPCKITTLNEIDSTAKHLDEFVAWLLGRRRQADLPGGGRSFRRRCEPLWQLWPFSPIIDEVHEVIFVDGIHLGRNAVVLIAQTPDCVLGWYAARSENSRAWGALMSRIAPPALVVTDGAASSRKPARESGRPRACNAAPSTRIAVSAKPPQRAPNWRPRVACTLLDNNSCTWRAEKMLRNGSMPTRGGARAGRTSWRRKHADLTEDGNTPTNVSFGLVTASTSSSPRDSCSRTWTPPGHIRCPR